MRLHGEEENINQHRQPSLEGLDEIRHRQNRLRKATKRRNGKSAERIHDEEQKGLNAVRKKGDRGRVLSKIEPRDLLLAFLAEKGASTKPNEPMDRIQAMKGLFLLTQEVSDLRGFFHFEPYLYGAVSFDVYRELDALEVSGLLVTTKEFSNDRWNRYFLTGRGMVEAKKAMRRLPRRTMRQIESTKKYVTSKPMYEMLKEIYAKYPEFAKKSVVRF